MKNDVHLYIKFKCPTCAFNKVGPAHGAMHTPPNGRTPWQAVCIDALDLEITASGRSGTFQPACRLSRSVRCYPINKTFDSKAFINLMLFAFIPDVGCVPEIMLSDRASETCSSRNSARSSTGSSGSDTGPWTHICTRGWLFWNASITRCVRWHVRRTSTTSCSGISTCYRGWYCSTTLLNKRLQASRHSSSNMADKSSFHGCQIWNYSWKSQRAAKRPITSGARRRWFTLHGMRRYRRQTRRKSKPDRSEPPHSSPVP